MLSRSNGDDMRLEAPVLKDVLLEAGKWCCRLFRNNRGLFFTMGGEKVRAGLETDGASDLIGFAQIEITPDMVGRKVAVFLAVETKKEGWKGPSTDTEKKQESFINFVRHWGGIAFFTNNPDDIKKHIDEYKRGA